MRTRIWRRWRAPAVSPGEQPLRRPAHPGDYIESWHNMPGSHEVPATPAEDDPEQACDVTA